jgi:hypothetical protein
MSDFRGGREGDSSDDDCPLAGRQAVYAAALHQRARVIQRRDGADQSAKVMPPLWQYFSRLLSGYRHASWSAAKKSESESVSPAPPARPEAPTVTTTLTLG